MDFSVMWTNTCTLGLSHSEMGPGSLWLRVTPVMTNYGNTKLLRAFYIPAFDTVSPHVIYKLFP